MDNAHFLFPSWTDFFLLNFRSQSFYLAVTDLAFADEAYGTEGRLSGGQRLSGVCLARG